MFNVKLKILSFFKKVFLGADMPKNKEEKSQRS
jgi:hypothetical protein